MIESIATEQARSPPARPARPVENGFFGHANPAVEHVSTVSASDTNKFRPAPIKTDVQVSSKSKKRASGRYSTGGSGAATGAERKGSIRNAVRKLFGRRSKDEIPEVPPVEVQRHGYHKSDPGQFLRPRTIGNHPSEPIHQRVISAPLSAPLAGPMSAPFLMQPPPFQLQPPPLSRKDRPLRSPNAVEFPKSARLKPLDLGNPFYTRVHGPKRRATLSSLIMTDHEAAKMMPKRRPTKDTRASLDIEQDRPQMADIGVAVTSDKKAKMAKRKSRSANDLKHAMMAAEPFRKRDDEIEYWRQSHASILVSPMGKMPYHGFPHPTDVPAVPEMPEIHDIPEIPEVVHGEDSPGLPYIPPADIRVQSPSERAASPIKASSLPSQHRSFSRPLISPTTDGPNDLEARISRLEAGLVDFQRSLSGLTMSNFSVTAPTEPPGSSQRHLPTATPSIMTESLQAPRNRGFEDAGDIMEREWGPSNSSSINGADRPAGPSPSPSTTRNNPTVTANGTFTALYTMLSEERSARRTLETQVRTLQHEVTRLQLSRGSWGSYSAQHLPQAQRPRTPASSDGGDDDNSNNHRRNNSRQEAYNALSSPATVVPPTSFLRAFDRPDGRIMSHFSGDSGEDSEYGSRHRSGESGPTSMPRASRGQFAEAAIPYESYRTAGEERRPYKFTEDEMF